MALTTRIIIFWYVSRKDGHLTIHRAGGRETVHLIAGTTVRPTIETSEPSALRKRFYPGLTGGGGIDFGRSRLRLLTELRYTRWTANLSGPGGVLRFDPNQFEFLLGMLF